jgi:hypothetical protein
MSAENEPPGMTVRVVYDRAANSHVAVELGGGWARLSVYVPDPGTTGAASLPDTVRILLAVGVTMIAAGGISPPDPTFVVAGPDATDLQREITLELLPAIWADLPTERASAPASSGVASYASKAAPGVQAAPQVRPTWPALRPDTKRADGPSAAPSAAERATEILAATFSGKPKRPAAGDHRHTTVIAKLATTVSRYRSEYGAAPDFGATKSDALQKVYKYIRSTTAQPNLTDADAEAIRLAVNAAD